MDKYKMTFGADPEFFVQEKKSKLIVPSCRLFGGDKGSPMFLSPDGGYLEDGTTVEFNVTPCITLGEVRKKLQNLLLVFLNKYDKYQIHSASVAKFSSEVLAKFPEACQIGCSPDLFAYGLRTAPAISKFGNYRFAGGHVHVGIDPWPEGLEKANLVKFLDLLFVCPSNAQGFCDPERYQFYGHPGLYRETKYGIEHRSPDNYWCNPAITGPRNLEWITDHIEQMDRAMQSVLQILNFDEHGARLNQEIDSYVKATNLPQVMQAFQTLKSPGYIQAFSSYGSETAHFAGRWVHERQQVQSNRAALAAKAG